MDSNLLSGAQVLLECLAREGVEHIFGYPGGATLPLYDALYDGELVHILVRHEQNACFAAEGYARASGKAGVCCATSGPGATNLITGLADALMDSIPVVAITGQVSTKVMGSDSFQEADTFGISLPCTKHNYLVRTLADLPRVVHEAFHIASTGRPGPVLIDIPKDVQQVRASYAPPKELALDGYRVPGEAEAGRIEEAARAIWNSQRPLVYAGGGIIAADASGELKRFVELVDVPAVCTLMGLGGLPAEHPNFISMPGMHGSYAANMAMSHADLLIALGTRFDDRVTGKLSTFAPHAKVIHVDIDRSEIGKNRAANVALVGHLKKVLGQLNEALLDTRHPCAGLNAAGRLAWRSQVAEWKADRPFDRGDAVGDIKPQYLMAEIDRVAQGAAVLTTDVGQHQMWAAQLVRFNEPRLWITSGGLGAMGFGLPAAIGAQLARPGKLVFALLGDGGFQMSVPELATIANYGLPIKIIIMNNGYLGMVRQWQELFHGNRLSAVKLDGFPDVAKLAEAYGLRGRTIERSEEVGPAIEEAVAAPGAYLLNVRVSPFENVYPIIPAGAAIHEMVLAPPRATSENGNTTKADGPREESERRALEPCSS